jgi:nitrate reductase gamma subunit
LIAGIVIYKILPYAVAAVLVFGLARRVWRWVRTPAPLKIFLPPSPATRFGAAKRLTGLVLPGAGYAGADAWLRVAASIFHLSLLLVFLRHLRYFLDPAPAWAVWFNVPGVWAGWVMPVALGLLLLRRLVWKPALLASRGRDFSALLLLLAISLTGLAMQWFAPPDVTGVKASMLGILRFSPSAPAGEDLFTAHFLLALVLAAWFPFSRLMHGLGLFFSPLLNQSDNLHLERHVNPWDPAGREIDT